MFSARRLRILGLALCVTTAGAVLPALARHSSAASASQELQVVGHRSLYIADYTRNPDRDVLAYRLTLHITGSNFGSSREVGIAVVNASRWAVVARGGTHSQPAGTIDYKMLLSPAPDATDLFVLYRSAGHLGMQTVTLR